MKNEILRLQKVSLFNEKEKILDHIYMNVFEGETVGIVGANGQGKNWLIQILSGRRRCSEGEIWINDSKVILKSIGDTQEKGIFLIHNVPVIMPHLSIAENIQLSVKTNFSLKFVNEKDIFGKTNKILKQLDLSLDAEDKTFEMSFGDRHIVEIVRAINIGAKILIFDDIDAGYTRSEKERLLSLIFKLKDRGVACVLFSYDADFVKKAAERIFCMKNGRITNVFSVHEINVEGIRKIMSNQLLNRKMEEQKKDVESIFRIKNMSGRKFTNLNIEIGCGEITALFFRAGGGTTEFIRMMINGSSNGDYYINDKKIENKSYKSLFDLNIAVLPDCYGNYYLMNSLGVSENLTIGFLKKNRRFHMFINKRFEKYLFNQIKENILVSGIEKENIHQLSAIEKRLLLLNRLYLVNPEVLIIESPTTGLDEEGKGHVYNILKRMSDRGTGILLVTSDMEEVTSICTRKVEVDNIV